MGNTQGLKAQTAAGKVVEISNIADAQSGRIPRNELERINPGTRILIQEYSERYKQSRKFYRGRLEDRRDLKTIALPGPAQRSMSAGRIASDR